MNYFEELNLFWRTGITSYLTPNASLLYLSLLDVANSRHWPEYIAQKSSSLEDRTGIEKRDTLRDARAKLKQIGLIAFDSKQGAKITAYKILGVENALKVLGIVPDIPENWVGLPEVDPKLTRSEAEVKPKLTRSCEPEANGDTDYKPSQKKQKEKKQKEIIFSLEFESFWEIYLNQIGKTDALKAWNARLKEGKTPEQITEAAKKYMADCKQRGTETQFIKHPKTFLGPGGHIDEWLKGGKPRGHLPGDLSQAQQTDPGENKRKALVKKLYLT